jgi:site-specific DNA recombinase
MRKTQETAAYYEIIEEQAAVVRKVYDWYTAEGLSIAAIMRRLNEQGVPTRKRLSRWERSTVWAMLRNPAYKGLACFGKTKLTQRQRITRPLRLRGGFASRDSAGHERPREEWIEIPVPALVSDTAFDLAQERLQDNKRLSPRRTVEWSIVQSLVSCSKCGYGMCRSSARTTARKIHYYRCLGSDAWRHLNGALCDNRPVRQDLLDQLVWNEILKLLEDPSLIEAEIERRLTAARNSNPNKRREESLQRDLTRTRKGMERLVTAYQETLLSLEDLRTRMPELRRREQTLQAELTSLTEQTNDRANYLRLTETLTAFMTRMRSSAQTLDIAERQRIVRLLIKEVLVGDDTITIRHSIPIPTAPSGNDTPPTSGRAPATNDRSYLLRKGSNCPALRGPGFRVVNLPGFQHSRIEPLVDQSSHHTIGDSPREDRPQLGSRDAVEVFLDIYFDHPITMLCHHPFAQDLLRLMSIAIYPIAEGAVQEVLFIYRLQQHHDCSLRYLVFEGGYTYRTITPSGLLYIETPDRRRSVAARFESVKQVGEVALQIERIPFRRLPVDPHRTVFTSALVGIPHPFRIEIVVQRGQRHGWVVPRESGYPLLFR